MTKEQPKHKRRKNTLENSYDSICLCCFQTIVSGVLREEDLEEFESKHECPPTALARRCKQFLHTI